MVKRYLKNAKITHVSYVDKGANKKQFFMTKSADTPNLTKNITALIKEDDEQQLVYGVVYEPDVEDAHGDAMTADEIEKAAHYFMKEARNIDKQHNFEEGYGEVVESYVAPADFEYGGETITKGSWVLVTKANDETWEGIKKGEITGYSMAGLAEVEEVAKQDDKIADKVLKGLKAMFTKGQVKDRFYENKLKRDVRSAFYIFDDILYEQFIWSNEPDVQVISDAARDLADLFEELANSPDIVKSLGGKEAIQANLLTPRTNTPNNQETAGETSVSKGKDHNNKEEEVNMNEELKKALQDVVKEAVKPFEDKLDELEGKVEKADGEPSEEEVEKAEKEKEEKREAVKKELKDIVKEAIDPLEERLGKVEKARGVKKGEENDGTGEEVEKSDDSIWDGLI